MSKDDEGNRRVWISFFVAFVVLFIIVFCGSCIYLTYETGKINISFETSYELNLSDVSISMINVDKPTKKYTAKYNKETGSCNKRLKNGIYQIEVIYGDKQMNFANIVQIFESQSNYTIDISVLAMSYIILDVATENGSELNTEDITVFGENSEPCGSTAENGQIFIPYVEDEEKTDNLTFIVSANGYKDKTVNIDANGGGTGAVQVVLEEK